MLEPRIPKQTEKNKAFMSTEALKQLDVWYCCPFFACLSMDNKAVPCVYLLANAIFILLSL